MEIKCSICGAMNDGNTNFCKECFQKLDITKKTIEEVKEEIVEVPIIEEPEKVIPWEEDSVPIEMSNVEDNKVSLEWETENEESLGQTRIDNWDINKINNTIAFDMEALQSGLEEKNGEYNTVDKDFKNKSFVLLKFFGIHFFSTVLIYGLISIFITKFTNMIGDEKVLLLIPIIFSLLKVISLVITSNFSVKTVKEENINKISYLLVAIICFPFILIDLFLLGFVLTNSLILFISSVVLELIVLNMIFSYFRNKLRKKMEITKEDKEIFKFGIVCIILIIAAIAFGMYAKRDNITMPSLPFFEQIFVIHSNDEIVNKFLDETTKTILRYQTETDGYVIPTVVTDVNYAIYKGIVPDSMELNINEQGGIISGEIIYNGITYYYDGETINTK